MAGRASGEHPGWSVWTSDAGHHYATKAGGSAWLPGASVTVDAASESGLGAAIAEAERDRERAARAAGR